jgi:hypothetical protein
VRLVDLATKCCAVALNTCGTIIAAFFLHTEMCIGSHARSRERQITEKCRGFCKIVDPEVWTCLCHPSHIGIWRPLQDFCRSSGSVVNLLAPELFF